MNWKEHNDYLVRGEKAVELKRKWNGVLPEIEVAIDDIESFIDGNQLVPTFYVNFVPGLSKEEFDGYMESLGLGYGEAVPWKEDMVSFYKRSAREVPELTAELRVASKCV